MVSEELLTIGSTNRQQYVTLNEANSKRARITCGVPQGSILGPILFLLYINDVNDVSNRLQSIMFADDTNLFHTGKLEGVERQMNCELVKVDEWFIANLLSLNVSKTSYIIFGNKKHSDIKLYMQNSSLIRQYHTKFLGVILPANLKWNKHIEIVLNKASKIIGIISKVRHLLPVHLTKMLYSTLVEPYFFYCNVICNVINVSSPANDFGAFWTKMEASGAKIPSRLLYVPV